LQGAKSGALKNGSHNKAMAQRRKWWSRCADGARVGGRRSANAEPREGWGICACLLMEADGWRGGKGRRGRAASVSGKTCQWRGARTSEPSLARPNRGSLQCWTRLCSSGRAQRKCPTTKSDDDHETKRHSLRSSCWFLNRDLDRDRHFALLSFLVMTQTSVGEPNPHPHPPLGDACRDHSTPHLCSKRQAAILASSLRCEVTG
jgi:hypothetical protein